MSFGRPSFVAVALLGHELAQRVVSVRSETATYGSTTGPFLGIGGSAMTSFTITELGLGGDRMLYFADDRFLGWSVEPAVRAVFPKLSVTTPGIHTSRDEVAQYLPADGRYDENKAAIARALAMGVSAETDDPDLHFIVTSLTGPQLDWVASWLASEGIGKTR